MAVMTEARLRKIVREEIGRQIREAYEPRLYKTSVYEPFYDTTLGDAEEWVKGDEDEEEEADVFSDESVWDPWTGQYYHHDPVTGERVYLNERRRRLLRRR